MPGTKLLGKRRRTTPSRGVTPRKKFAAQANVESRVRGKNGDEAHSRQLRVMNFFEYCNVGEKGTPVPIRGSFSYAVTDGEIAEATGLLKVQGVARGSGTVPRMQCVADGEEALDYLNKRRGNMRYGWLRRNGYQ